MAKLITPKALLQHLPPLPDGARLWIGFSGGCDSTVLLHLLHQLQAQLQIELRAIHINHSLSPFADEWTEHCRKVCAELDVPFVAVKVDAKPKQGESPEDAARRARYNAIMGQFAAGDYLCTAHHQDDQAETLLLQLLRGAGPKGLAAMAMQSPLGNATQLRPMLHLSREEIQHYAEANNLQWVDDHSNSDTGYNRNYLRHEVMPLLKQRWPSAARTISRGAEHCAEAAELLQHLAEQDFQRCSRRVCSTKCFGHEAQHSPGGTVPDSTSFHPGFRLNIAAMQQLPLARQKNLLRYWIAISRLSLPSEVKLMHIIRDVMEAAEDRMPCVAWPGAEVRRYDGELYIMPPLPPIDPGLIIPWPELVRPLSLTDGRSLVAQAADHHGALSAARLQQGRVTIRFRQGGERIQPAGASHHKSLKQLLQERRIPFWLRDRTPLVYVDDELVAVVGVCVTQAAVALREGDGVEIRQIGAVSS